MDGCWMVGWLEKAELKPTQPSLAGAWLSLAIYNARILYTWERLLLPHSAKFHLIIIHLAKNTQAANFEHLHRN